VLVDPDGGIRRGGRGDAGDVLHRLDERLRAWTARARRDAARPRRHERHRHHGHPARTRLFATAGSTSKCSACERLGAERAINYKTEDFVEVVKEITGGKGVDVIVDMVGGDYLSRNLDALAIDGRLVQISFLKGSHVELNLNPLMRKRLTLTGSTLRPRTPAEKGVIALAACRIGRGAAGHSRDVPAARRAAGACRAGARSARGQDRAHGVIGWRLPIAG
jgi:hypothetical protein